MNDETEIPDADTDALDRTLTALFAEVRPDAGLEERAVQALRADVRRKQAFHGWQRKMVVGLAASVGLGLCGAAIGSIPGGLPFPGEGEATSARIHREAMNSDAQFESWVAPEYASALRGHELGRKSYGNEPFKVDTALPSWGESKGGVRQEKSAGSVDIKEFEKELANPDVGLDSKLKAAVESDKEKDAKVDSKVVPNETFGLAGLGKPADPKMYYENYLSLATVDHPASKTQSSPGFNFNSTSSTAANGPTVTGGTFGFGGSAGGGGFGGGRPGGGSSGEGKRPEEAPSPGNSKPAVSPYLNLLRGKEESATINYYGLVQPTPVENPKPVVEPQTAARKVIRSGDIEFEVESFDSSVAAVTLLVSKIPGGFVATVNSDKLPNGKVKGAIVVRVPPESLDALVLDLRKELGKAGELKGQKIGSQDITKQYTDLESRLRAAKAMEQRLLKIIAEGKGEIKQLLEAERELGVWRTKIEEAEGELRYYANLVSLSTLTIALQEKEMRVAAGITACEHVDAGLEVEDVNLAYREVMQAVLDAKGRVTKAELKQQNANQFNAAIAFELAPEAAGPMQDRLKQLGRVARMQIDLVQTADGGPVLKDTKVKRGDTAFNLNLYSLATIAPRETVAMQLAAADVPASYRVLQDAVAKAKGRVLAANLNEQDRQNVTAQFDFEIRRTEEAAFQTALLAVGEIISRTVTRAVETDAVTDAKILYQTRLINVAKLKPRETTTLTVEVTDVDAATAMLAAQVAEVKGRPVDSQTSRDRAGTVTAKLTYAVPQAAAPGVIEKMKQSGTVRVFDTTRDPQAADGPSATARISVTLTNVDPIVASDDGVWPQVRKGLTYSVSALLKSVTWVIFGACVLLPWALLGYGGYRLVRRLFRTKPA